MVAAEVGVMDKIAKKWLFTSLVVLTAYLAVFIVNLLERRL